MHESSQKATNAYCGGAPGLDRSLLSEEQGTWRYPRTARLRFRYDNLVGPWFNWLYVSRSEMRLILRGTGWRQEEVLGVRSSEPYVAILEKD